MALMRLCECTVVINFHVSAFDVEVGRQCSVVAAQEPILKQGPSHQLDLQDDMERRMTELSATVAKVQQLQQNLTFQVQKADAERQKELRRAREAATKAAIVDQQRQERERQSAEARASDAAAVQLLQQENTQLKARVTALEKLLTQDGIQELVQKAVLASESKAAAAGALPVPPLCRRAQSQCTGFIDALPGPKAAALCALCFVIEAACERELWVVHNAVCHLVHFLRCSVLTAAFG